MNKKNNLIQFCSFGVGEMKPILYVWEVSPPCRSVQLLVKHLNLDFELKTVLLIEREQFNEEFLKKNPIHTIPTLDDGGNCFFESHAIMTYLVDKYAADDSLYARDLVERTKANALLHFDTGFLFPNLRAAYNPVLYEGATEISKAIEEKCNDILTRLEALLTVDKPYLMGNDISLAEFSMIPTLSAYEVLFPISSEKYPKIFDWRKRVFANFPNFAVSENNSIKLLRHTVDEKIKENLKLK